MRPGDRMPSGPQDYILPHRAGEPRPTGGRAEWEVTEGKGRFFGSLRRTGGSKAATLGFAGLLGATWRTVAQSDISSPTRSRDVLNQKLEAAGLYVSNC